MVDGGAQAQQKNVLNIWRLQIQKTKRNLSESNLENEAADFPRFIVIESLEEVCLAKFLPFLIEKVISTRASLKTVKKTRNGNLLVKVDSWKQAENILKIKNFHTMNAEPTCMRNSTLPRELSGVESWYWLPKRREHQPWENRELQIYEESPSEKMKNKSRSTLTF